MEIKKRLKKYGSDFTKLNRQINVSNSDTIYKKMSANKGEMWEEYHRRLRDTRKTWSVDPLDRIMETIEKMPHWLPIGDFGCGKAQIQDAIGLNVISFEHVAIDDFTRVKCCDIGKALFPGGLQTCFIVFSQICFQA